MHYGDSASLLPVPACLFQRDQALSCPGKSKGLTRSFTYRRKSCSGICFRVWTSPDAIGCWTRGLLQAPSNGTALQFCGHAPLGSLPAFTHREQLCSAPSASWPRATRPHPCLSRVRISPRGAQHGLLAKGAFSPGAWVCFWSPEPGDVTGVILTSLWRRARQPRGPQSSPSAWGQQLRGDKGARPLGSCRGELHMGSGPEASLPTWPPRPLRCPRGQAGSRFPAPLLLPERSVPGALGDAPAAARLPWDGPWLAPGSAGTSWGFPASGRGCPQGRAQLRTLWFAGEMADGGHLHRGSSSPASSRRGSQAAPMDASEEARGQDPPPNGVCLSRCRHCFCFPCIQEWARRSSVCPRCQGSLNHIFPMRDRRIHEGHEEGRERPLPRQSDGRRPCPFGRRNGRSCRRARGRGQGRGSARSRSRSRRWHRNNHRWSRRGWRSTLRCGRRCRSTVWGMGHNGGQGLPPECAVLGHWRRRRSRRQRGRRRRLRRHSGQARRQRTRGWYEQQALHPSLDVPVPPRAGERRQRRGPSRNRRRSRQGQRSRARRGTV